MSRRAALAIGLRVQHFCTQFLHVHKGDIVPPILDAGFVLLHDFYQPGL